jgi:tetratricopeptide (TPR) repeat protein
MPETARILQFRQSTRRKALSSVEAGAIADRYLAAPLAERSDEFVAATLEDPDVILAALSRLRGVADGSPRTVVAEAIGIYQWLLDKDSLGLFDERDYFLGESALLAGSALRLLGRRDDAELWLDRAEAAFRHIVNPAPQLANISYARLTLHYDCRRFERALELLPSLTQSFTKLGMEREAMKCRFLEAMSLKNLSRSVEALKSLQAMAADPALLKDNGMHGLVLLNLGDLSTQSGQTREGVSLYQQALPLLQRSNQAFAVAHLKGLIAETMRADGNLTAAVECFRGAIADYAGLEMVTWVAYLRIVLAETLIALDRNREAEWEILSALPTIEEQKMVPDGFAAVGLLRESVSRREADPSALRDLRERLRADR